MTPGRGPGRPALISRDAAVDAACDLADTEGVDAVSMRAVGHALGVTPMSLYRHITDKKALLAAMVERAAAEYDLDALDGDWREQLLQLARQQKALIHRHPWLPTLASRYHPLGPATLTYVERLLELLAQSGLPQSALMETVGLINGLVTALSVAASERPSPPPHDAHDLPTLLATGRYPLFAALAGQPHLDLDLEFDRLVLRLIDGLAAHT